MKKLMMTGLMLTAFNVLAQGHDVGNGGVSLVCRDQNKKITSAKVLDIYEGEVRHKRTYDKERSTLPSSSLSVDTRVELAQLKLTEHSGFLKAFRKELAQVKAILNYIPVGEEILPTNDAFPTIVRKGCEFEQLANYTNDGDLLVSEEIHNELDDVNQAALLVHETVYALFRTKGAKDSQQARKLTAHLLAKNPDQAVIDAIVKKNYGGTTAEGKQVCGTKGSVEARIAACDSVSGKFRLVARMEKGYEVWKDMESGLMWSDRLSESMNHYDALKACKPSLPEMAGLGGSWRLPTDEEFKTANSNGIRSSIASMKNRWWWSSSVHRNYSDVAWLFDGYNGNVFVSNRVSSDSVRCVAR